MADTMIGRFLQGYSVDDLCRQFDLPPRAVEQAIRDSVSGVDQPLRSAVGPNDIFRNPSTALRW